MDSPANSIVGKHLIPPPIRVATFEASDPGGGRVVPRFQGQEWGKLVMIRIFVVPVYVTGAAARHLLEGRR
jgi:hypothetical protein